VDVRINAPQVLIKEILRKPKGSVFVSSLTDPYQPLEKKYELTRKCLKILLENNFSLWIQTKSALIKRDIDILKKFKERCEVGFTITTLDEKIKEIFEPYSSNIKERLECLKILKDNEIKTFVFFGPMLPFLSDTNLEEFVEIMTKLKIDCLWVDRLYLKAGIWKNLENVLKKNYPELLPKWKEVLFEKMKYWENLKEKVTRICRNNEINFTFCY
jgi:DNA repair photolyase